MVPASFAPLSFAGEDWALSPCGALWWPAQKALVVADLHLEKASWFAARGQLLPPYDSHATLTRLAAAQAASGAGTVYCLGDSFHDANGPTRLAGDAAALLEELTRAARFVWIAGNHDAEAAPLGAERCEDMVVGGVRLVHQTHPNGATPEISGHFHPKFAVSIRGRRITRPCAVRSANRLILPAYGALTGGMPAADPAIRAALWPDRQAEALIASEGRLLTFALRSEDIQETETRHAGQSQLA